MDNGPSTTTQTDVVDSTCPVQTESKEVIKTEEVSTVSTETESAINDSHQPQISDSKEDVKDVNSSHIPINTPVNDELKVDTTELGLITPEKVNENKCGVCFGVYSTPVDSSVVDLSPHAKTVKTYTEETFWIQCDGCEHWFHGNCVNIEEVEYGLYSIFHCPECIPTKGPSSYHEIVAPHRLQFDQISQIDMPTEIGTKKWIEEFMVKEKDILPPGDDYCDLCTTGLQFMDKFDQESCWDKIFLIKDPEGLQMRMPEQDFNTETLIELFGNKYMVDTIDVYRQVTHSMSLGKFHEKFSSKDRPRLYNFLSLEFSKNEKMRELIAPPLVVNCISFVHSFWPEKDDPVNYDREMDFLPNHANALDSIAVAENHKISKPEVALFCLCGMANSYTDFHIDFGGSSVWYHIYKGQKIFYVVPPTPENLDRFEEYQKSENRSETFFGDLLPPGELRRVVINQGETLMIPSGWIHAVLTPVDSLVFGGNFLHLQNLSMQLKIYNMEQRIKAHTGLDDKFLFPHFELVMWYAARSVVITKLKDNNDAKTVAPTWLLEGARDLRDALLEWLSRNENDSLMKTQSQLASSLKKAIEAQERLVNSDLRKSRTKKKKNSYEGSDDDDYTPVKPKMRKKHQKPKFELLPPLVDTDDYPPTDLPPEEPRPSSRSPSPKYAVVLTKKGKRYSSEVVEKPSTVFDSVDMVQMFAQRSSSGRTHKLSGWLAATAGDQIELESRRLEESGAMPTPRQPLLGPDVLSDVDEEDEWKSTTQKKKKKVVKPADASEALKATVTKKKAAPTTAKQRLAAKMKLK